MHFVYGGLHCTIWKLLSRGGRPKWKCVVRGCSLPRGALRARASRAPSALLKMENGKFCTTINRKTSATTFATTADWRTSSLHPPDSTFAFSGFSGGEITASAISGRRFFWGGCKKKGVANNTKNAARFRIPRTVPGTRRNANPCIETSTQKLLEPLLEVDEKGGASLWSFLKKLLAARGIVSGEL